MTNPTFIEITKDFPQWRENNLVALAKDKRSGIYNLHVLSATSCEFWHEGEVIVAKFESNTAQGIDNVQFSNFGSDYGDDITAYSAAVVQLYMYLVGAETEYCPMCSAPSTGLCRPCLDELRGE